MYHRIHKLFEPDLFCLQLNFLSKCLGGLIAARLNQKKFFQFSDMMGEGRKTQYLLSHVQNSWLPSRPSYLATLNAQEQAHNLLEFCWLLCKHSSCCLHHIDSWKAAKQNFAQDKQAELHWVQFPQSSRNLWGLDCKLPRLSLCVVFINIILSLKIQGSVEIVPYTRTLGFVSLGKAGSSICYQVHVNSPNVFLYAYD